MLTGSRSVSSLERRSAFMERSHPGRRQARHAQREPEPAPVARLAVHPHLPAVRRDDLPRDVQAEADPFPFGPRHPEELLEDALLVLGRDARALVLDLEADEAALGPGPHQDAPALRAVADGVADQVVEHEADALRI